MKCLTTKQRSWLIRKTIKENECYMFPRCGHTVYWEPNFESGEYVDANPFNRSLDNEMFIVKEKINGFYRGNFHNKPNEKDMYLSEEELSRREIIEMLLLLIIFFIPLTIYNIYEGGVEKIENRTCDKQIDLHRRDFEFNYSNNDLITRKQSDQSTCKADGL